MRIGYFTVTEMQQSQAGFNYIEISINQWEQIAFEMGKKGRTKSHCELEPSTHE